jgi:hypothetical protein
MTAVKTEGAKTPDQIVEDSIIASLQEKKLIGDAELKKLQTKIAAGSLKSGDWKLIFEMSVDKETGKTEAADEN